MKIIRHFYNRKWWWTSWSETKNFFLMIQLFFFLRISFSIYFYLYDMAIKWMLLLWGKLCWIIIKKCEILKEAHGNKKRDIEIRFFFVVGNKIIKIKKERSYSTDKNIYSDKIFEENLHKKVYGISWWLGSSYIWKEIIQAYFIVSNEFFLFFFRLLL